MTAPWTIVIHGGAGLALGDKLPFAHEQYIDVMNQSIEVSLLLIIPVVVTHLLRLRLWFFGLVARPSMPLSRPSRSWRTRSSSTPGVALS